MMGRTDAAGWAAAITHQPDVLYLDTETTGLGRADEIVDIAVLDNAGRVLLNTLVKPRRPIPPDATAIHRISDHHVRNAPAWPEVYRLLIELLGSYHHVVVYNADFDRRLIGQSCSVHLLPAPNTQWHCAMKQYAVFAGDRSGYYGGYRWFKLEQAIARLGLSDLAEHRALADARACRAVVHAMACQQVA